MFNNLIKYSIRSFKKQRAYVIINVLGLSIGIACSLLIAFFVIDEASYDRYNVRKERIFNVILNFQTGGQVMKDAATSPPMGPTMLQEFPEIEDFLRMKKVWASTVNYNNQIYFEDRMIEADSSFFKFFSIPVLQGDINNLLNAPRKVVISESSAKRIFGDDNPVYKTIRIGKDTTIYTITGVMADIPGNSHFEADIIISFMSDPESNSLGWTNSMLNTYLLLKPNTSYEKVDAKLPGLVIKYIGPEIQRVLNISFSEFISMGNEYGYYLQKLTDIHLDTSVQPHFKAAGDPKFLKILGTIAVLILLIAVINFTNLSTAQASRRSKEVGIKKISGSSKGMLITQFLSESMVLAFLSTVFGLGIIKIILPYFNDLLEIDLQMTLLSGWYFIPVLLIFSMIVGVLAGGYPAFFLSSFNPYEVLKGNVKNSRITGWMRRVLVVFQFTVSIILIVGTLIMYRQLTFMLRKEVGFSKEHLIVIKKAEELGAKSRSFKEAVNAIPGVIKISGSTSVPGNNNNYQGYMLEGNKDETILMWTNWIDNDFFETYGMTLRSGRLFNESFSTDQQSCIVNESAIKKYNILDLEKTRIMGYLDSGKVEYYPIIGVVKDFTFESHRNQIGPYIFRFKTDYDYWRYLTLKVSAGDYSKIIKQIERIWKQFIADEPFDYYFLNDNMEQLYIRERQTALMAVISAILAIFVAVLGLFGLTSYSVDQRTKEIGVRKAMGSTVLGIYTIISREIIVLVIVSSLIAYPIIYYLADKWLENFYYRINQGVLSFAAGLMIALGIAILTISFKVWKAAGVIPAESLKYD